MIDSHGMNLNLVFKLWFESHEVITLSVYMYIIRLLIVQSIVNAFSLWYVMRMIVQLSVNQWQRLYAIDTHDFAILLTNFLLINYIIGNSFEYFLCIVTNNCVTYTTNHERWIRPWDMRTCVRSEGITRRLFSREIQGSLELGEVEIRCVTHDNAF